MDVVSLWLGRQLLDWGSGSSFFFFFSSRRRHTRCLSDWSSDVCFPIFNSKWLGTLTLQASSFHHTKDRNSHIGLALAFPFSSTAITTSGFETFGDNQFVTGIRSEERRVGKECRTQW